MNQKENILQTTTSAGEYIAPSVKVAEMKARRMMCQASPVTTGIGGMQNENDDW